MDGEIAVKFYKIMEIYKLCIVYAVDATEERNYGIMISWKLCSNFVDEILN